MFESNNNGPLVGAPAEAAPRHPIEAEVNELYAWASGYDTEIAAYLDNAPKYQMYSEAYRQEQAAKLKQDKQKSISEKLESIWSKVERDYTALEVRAQKLIEEQYQTDPLDQTRLSNELQGVEAHLSRYYSLGALRDFYNSTGNPYARRALQMKANLISAKFKNDPHIGSFVNQLHSDLEVMSDEARAAQDAFESFKRVIVSKAGNAVTSYLGGGLFSSHPLLTRVAKLRPPRRVLEPTHERVF